MSPENPCRKYLCSLVLCLLFSGCQRVPDHIEPTLQYSVQDKYLQSLPSPFSSLTGEEKTQDWGREMEIGFGFAHELDLYQAITAFKRAQFLISPEEKMRALEIHYEILLCYYTGKKWKDVVYTFEHSPLRYANADFPAFHDLLLIMFETYEHEGKQQQAERFLEVIRHNYPQEGEKLILSRALVHADLSTVGTIAAAAPQQNNLDPFLQDYSVKKKSVGTAQMLNGFFPGAGYFYLGQTQSAITAFFLNGLFIATSVYFFHEGNVAAGLIFTSFEAGWYFGGIYGAGLEAKVYNERLYESMASPMMVRERLFPALMLNYAF